MAKVFVSYSRKDTEFAKKLTGELQKSDLDFWIDWEGIPPTVDWWKEIEKGIEESDVFIFLISPDSAKSKICIQEIDVAVKNGKRIIPIVVRDIAWEDTSKHLGHLNYIFFRESDDFDAAVKKLMTAIQTDYEWAATHRRLQVKALEWERNKKEHSFLLRGKDLQEAELQLATNSSKEPHPTDLQREYVFGSRKAVDRQRRIATGISVAGIIALAVLAVFGFYQAGQATNNAATAQANLVVAQTAQVDARNKQILADNNAATAVANEQEAKRQAQIALARQWAAEANAMLANPNGNAETAALLSLRALQLQDEQVPSAVAALVESLNHLYTEKIFDQHNAKVSAVGYSPTGDRISIGYVDGTVGLYDVNTGLELKHFDVEARYDDGNQYEEGIHAVAFSADGNFLLAADSGGHIIVWNPVTYAKEVDFNVQEKLPTWKPPLWSAKFSPNAKYILISSGYPHADSGNIYLFERQTGEMKIPFAQLHTRYITDVEFSPDGNQVLSTSFDCTAILWEINWETFTATRLQTFNLSAPIRDGAISADGKLVLLGSDNNTAELYTTEGVRLNQFIGHTNSIFSVNFSPIEGYILTGSWDNTARLWDMNSARLLRTFTNHADFVSSTAFSPDGKQIVTGSYDKTARLWNADPIHDTRTIYGHSNRINSVSYSPDGKFILSSSTDNSVRLWNSETLESESILSTSLSSPMAVFSAQGHWIAVGSGTTLQSGGSDLKIVLWEKVGSEYKQTGLLDPVELVTSLAFSPQADGRESEYLLSGRGDPNCYSYLWQNVNTTWKVVREYYAWCWHNDVAFTLDAQFAAIATGAHIPIYQIGDETQPVAECYVENGAIVSFLNDGKHIVYAEGNSILIWDWQTNPTDCAQARRLEPLSAPVKDLVFSPDGNYLLSASTDGTATLWDAKTWEKIRIIARHDGEITSMAFSPNGKFIVTGGGDKTIRIWDTDYKDTIKLVCALLQRLNRDFTDEERIKYGINDTDRTCGK